MGDLSKGEYGRSELQRNRISLRLANEKHWTALLIQSSAHLSLYCALPLTLFLGTRYQALSFFGTSCPLTRSIQSSALSFIPCRDHKSRLRPHASIQKICPLQMMSYRALSGPVFYANPQWPCPREDTENSSPFAYPARWLIQLQSIFKNEGVQSDLSSFNY